MSAPRLLRLIYHTVGNIRFDVGTITRVEMRKRLFCIFDRDRPYVLTVTTFEPHQSTDVQPAFVDGKIGFTLQNTYEPYKRRHFRVISREACQEYVWEIEEKQKKLDQIEAQYREQMLRSLRDTVV